MSRLARGLMLLAALALLVLPAIVTADVVYSGPHFKTTEVIKSRHYTAGGSGNFWFTSPSEQTTACPTCGHYDSLTWAVVGKTTTAKTTGTFWNDTSVWISTKEIAPKLYQNDVTAAKDTAAWFSVQLSPASSICDADSLWLTIQGSMDGSTVLTTNPYPVAQMLAVGTGAFEFSFSPTSLIRLKLPLIRLILTAQGTDTGFFYARLAYLTNLIE